MRLIGAVRFCDQAPEVHEIAINALAEYVDGFVVVSHHVKSQAQYLAKLVKHHKCLGHEAYHEAWNHELTLLAAYKLAKEQVPDWIIIPDYDELLPYDMLDQEISAINSEPLRYRMIMFPFVNCWERPDRLVDQRLNQTGTHAKVFRSTAPEPNFEGSGGFCVPNGWWKYAYTSRYPLRHMHLMTATQRRRRAMRSAPWASPKRQFSTLAYHPGATLREIELASSLLPAPI
jgi:hypothetical protein